MRRFCALWILGAAACSSAADEPSVGDAAEPRHDGAVNGPRVDAADAPPAFDAATTDAARGEDAAVVADARASDAMPTIDAAGVADAWPAADAPALASAPLVINEVMAKNRLSVRDELGRFADWVELYNPGDVAVSLDGWAITDDFAVPRKRSLASELVVPAGGHLLLWLDGEAGLGPAHVDLTLVVEGGRIGLTGPDGTFADRVVYGAQSADVAAARLPDGAGSWRVVWQITPGAANPPSDGPPLEPGPDPETIPAAGDLSEDLLGEHVIPEIGIALSPAAMDELRAAPYTWVAGELHFEGRVLAPVGVRLKGQNSFQPIDQKPSLKIKVDYFFHGAELLGVDDLTLNNMDDDPSMMHERVGYRIARMAGVPASRANHALVTVNGAHYGLYTQIETVERRLIARWFGDAAGPLFEGWDVDFVEAYIPLYGHEGGPDDRSALYALADALLLPGPEAMAAAAEWVDLDAFRRYWAVCAVIGQFDAFPYSSPGDDYLLYVDPITGRMSFLPWGMDETFNWAAGPVLEVTSVLAQRCLEVPACADALITEIWALVDAIEAADMPAELDLIAAEIAPLVAADGRKPYTDAAVVDEQDNMRWFVSTRRSTLEAQLPAAVAEALAR